MSNFKYITKCRDYKVFYDFENERFLKLYKNKVVIVTDEEEIEKYDKIDEHRYLKNEKRFIAKFELFASLVIIFTSLSISYSVLSESAKKELKSYIIAEYEELKNKFIIPKYTKILPIEPEKKEYIITDPKILKAYNLINDYEINYSDTYHFSDEEIKLLNNYMQCESECEYTFNGDIDKYVDNIINNSKKMHLNKNEMQIFSSDESSNMNKIKSSVSNSLKNYFNNLYQNGTNDINEDFHKLANLRIVFDTDYNSGANIFSEFIFGSYYNKKSTCYINVYEHISKICIERNISFSGYDDIENLDDNVIAEVINSIDNTIYHELNHARQYKCSCRVDDIGVIFYPNVSHSFILETTAESAILNQQQKVVNYKATCYSNERKFENAILMLLAFRSDVTLDDYYSAVFDSSNNDLYNLFDENIYEIMYWYDAYLGRADCMYDKDIIINNNHTSLEVIYKNYLTNLMNYNVQNNNLTIDDNIILLQIGRSIIKNNIYDEDEELFNTCNELTNYYYEFMCSYYNISREELDNYVDNNISDLIKAYNILFKHKNIEAISEIDDEIVNKVIPIHEKLPILDVLTNNINVYNDRYYYVEQRKLSE